MPRPQIAKTVANTLTAGLIRPLKIEIERQNFPHKNFSNIGISMFGAYALNIE
jgi:hypothetical protein